MPPQNQLPLPTLLPRPAGAPRRDPSPPLESRKRRYVAAACLSCRKQKKKCSGERPTCHQCQVTEAKCVYDAAEGLTSRQAHRQMTLEFQNAHEDFQGVIDLLRSGTESDAVAALRRIREAENAQEAVETVSVAQALLTASSSTAQASSSTQYASQRPAKPRITSPFQHPDHMFEKHYRYARDQYVDNDVFVDLPSLCLDFSRWTSACSENRLINHLMLMFWT